MGRCAMKSQGNAVEFSSMSESRCVVCGVQR